jgi:hypothetical protein
MCDVLVLENCREATHPEALVGRLTPVELREEQFELSHYENFQRLLIEWG